MATDERDCSPIPHPRSLPFLGDALAFTGDEPPIMVIGDMARQHGEIFSLKLLGQRYCFVSSQQLLRELCDERRFGKVVVADLEVLRSGGVYDGLFTSDTNQPSWGIAHRVLVPAFGPLNIRGMFDPMKDIASQLVLKWVRHGPLHHIAVTGDFTRLTLDTIALCAMDYRFNSFYSEHMHPFVEAMVSYLKYSEIRANTPSYLRLFSRGEKKRSESMKYMRELSRELVQGRRDHPRESKDLLNAMIVGVDPKTGQHIAEESVIDNMITFLVAGHETTSGALSFTFYYLLKHPRVLKKAQQEVDEVVGEAGIQLEHLSKLPYLTAILREALRLQPTAPAFTFAPKSEQGEVLAGKYYLPPGQAVHAILYNVHRDPAVYGDNAEDFVPERMLDANFNELPPCSWKPFGNGSRGCIGFAFAWQEMMLVMAMLLRYFNFEIDDPDYSLQIASTLTVKPKNFYMKAEPRARWTAGAIERDVLGATALSAPSLQPQRQRTDSGIAMPSEWPRLNILYGSNSGTCEAFARLLAGDAAAHGYAVATVDTLNSAPTKYPDAEMVIIVTASYEGQPCDNAAEFFSWLQELKGDGKFTNHFAVFGCGHSDWKSTFHRIPKAIDRLLEENGATRICAMGSSDAATGDMMSDFQTWEDKSLWPSLAVLTGQNSPDKPEGQGGHLQKLTVDLVEERPSILLPDVAKAKVTEARTLTAYGVPAKRHIAVQLPLGMTYNAGDYCTVLPTNPPEIVRAAMLRMGLSSDAVLKLSSPSKTFLPVDEPVAARILFSSYLELSSPATKRDIKMLIEATNDGVVKNQLEALVTGFFHETITNKRISILDLLQEYPTIQLALASYIGSLMPIRSRQYSISSSPSMASDRASLTYSVLREPARSGKGQHIGVASNYLAALQPGDTVEVAIRSSHQSFHLPKYAGDVPIVMIAAGAGVAPFRGFLEERCAQMKLGLKLAPALLYYGCRHPEQDDLYRAQIDAWEAMGVVTSKRAYSRAPEISDRKAHIDEVIKAEGAAILQAWNQGAIFYVCGSRALGDSVKAAFLEIMKEEFQDQERDGSGNARDRWFESIRGQRYVADLFD